MTSPIAQSARIIAELRERLKAEYGLADDDEALETTLEGASDLPEQLAFLAREAMRCEAMAEAMQGIIRRNQDRKARLEHKADKLRSIIAWAMEESGTKKLALPDMTLSMKMGRSSLVIPDESCVPLSHTEATYKPNKALIRGLLEQGQQLDFAHLGNPRPSLTILTK